MKTLHRAYGRQQDDMSCRDRLERLVDKTGLYISDDVRFPVRANVQGSIHFDHVTLLTDIDGRLFIMNEPYGDPEGRKAELDASGMSWILVPEKYGPYGNGTRTYLITFPWHSGALRNIGLRLDLPYDDLPHRS